MRKQHIPTLTASALAFIAICIILIRTRVLPGARSQAIATQGQASSAELSAAIEAQREASAKLTCSASFDQRLQKLIEKAQKKGTVSVIVKVRSRSEQTNTAISSGGEPRSRTFTALRSDDGHMTLS